MSPLGAWIVLPAGTASSSRLRTLGLVNSPRSITSQLPRRDEKTLRSAGPAPCAISQRAASLATGIAPAGDLWSVLPSYASTSRGAARSRPDRAPPSAPTTGANGRGTQGEGGG